MYKITTNQREQLLNDVLLGLENKREKGCKTPSCDPFGDNCTCVYLQYIYQKLQGLNPGQSLSVTESTRLRKELKKIHKDRKNNTLLAPHQGGTSLNR